jgi:hypothetical protein
VLSGLLLCAWWLPLTLSADRLNKKLAATLAVEPPVIDGRLEDASWQKAPVLADFHLVEPVEFGVPPMVPKSG